MADRFPPKLNRLRGERPDENHHRYAISVTDSADLEVTMDTTTLPVTTRSTPPVIPSSPGISTQPTVGFWRPPD